MPTEAYKPEPTGPRLLYSGEEVACQEVTPYTNLAIPMTPPNRFDQQSIRRAGRVRRIGNEIGKEEYGLDQSWSGVAGRRLAKACHF